MNTVLFFPGFKEDIMSRDYRNAINAIKSKGYHVVFVSVNWKRTTIHDWIIEAEREYKKYDPKNTILAGFSYGSLIAFMLSTKRNPSELWLFSLSPYFSEDVPKLKQTWLDSIGKRRVETFKQLDFDRFAKTITCKTLIFMGEIEAKNYPLLEKRARLAKQSLANSNLITVLATGHDVGHLNYIEAIKSSI